jgi:RNA:NAD 2'-phosphotransferase (TPT1/KptA family)
MEGVIKMYTTMNENKTLRKSPATFYKNQNDLKRALLTVIDVLREAAEKEVELIKVGEYQLTLDSEGFAKVDDIVALLKWRYSELSYINRNHIIELYFKDRDQKILINGDNLIKYKIVKYVQPPQTLYFGTLKNLAERMKESGLISHTKKYIKLYETAEMAIDFAKKFATRQDDEIVVLEVNAGKAFSDGMKFSTYKEGEFIIVKVDRKYIVS